MSVIDSPRSFWPRASASVETGLGRLALANLTSSRLSSCSLPSVPTRRITGEASGPWPRETDRYAFPEAGLTTTSLIVTCCGRVPSRSATAWLMFSTRIFPPGFEASRSPVSTAKRAAPWVSPMKRIPPGPNASGPADLRSGLPFCRPALRSFAPPEEATSKEPISAAEAIRQFRDMDASSDGETVPLRRIRPPRERWHYPPPRPECNRSPPCSRVSHTQGHRERIAFQGPARFAGHAPWRIVPGRGSSVITTLRARVSLVSKAVLRGPHP